MATAREVTLVIGLMMMLDLVSVKQAHASTLEDASAARTNALKAVNEKIDVINTRIDLFRLENGVAAAGRCLASRAAFNRSAGCVFEAMIYIDAISSDIERLSAASSAPSDLIHRGKKIVAAFQVSIRAAVPVKLERHLARTAECQRFGSIAYLDRRLDADISGLQAAVSSRNLARIRSYYFQLSLTSAAMWNKGQFCLGQYVHPARTAKSSWDSWSRIVDSIDGPAIEDNVCRSLKADAWNASLCLFNRSTANRDSVLFKAEAMK